MKIAIALMFTIACYAGDCLAASPNVVTSQQGYHSATVKKGKSKSKGKKKKKKKGSRNPEGQVR